MAFKFISNFVGGLNTFLPPKYLKSNESQILLDAEIRRGQVESVKSPLLAHPGTGGYYIRNFFADSGHNVWFTHNNPILYVDYMDAVYFSAPNELEDIYKKSPDGVNTYQIGVDTPTLAPTLSLSTLLNSPSVFTVGEVVQYVYTAYKHGSESSPSPVANIEIQNETDAVVIETPLASTFGAESIRIYRAGGGAGDFLLIHEFGGGQYTDNKSGAELGKACDSWGNEKPPQGLILDTYYRGYFIGHVDYSSELRFSQPTNIESWNPLDMVRFDSKIVRAVPYSGSIVVFCESGVYQLVGTSIEDFQKVEIPTEQNCVNEKSIIVHDNVLWYQSPDGICVYDGANVKVVSQPKIAKSWFSGRKLTAASRDGRLYFGDASSILAIDIDYGMAFSEFSPCPSLVDLFYNPADDRLYASNYSDIYQMFEGSEMAMQYRTGNLTNSIEDGWGSDILLKTFRTVRIIGEGTFDITLVVDGQTVATYPSIQLDQYRPTLLFFPRAARGYAGQVEFHGIGRVTGLHIEYYPEGANING